MNERIKELIEECTIITTDMVYDGCDSFLEQTESFDKEKFAELIVRECMRVSMKATGLDAEYEAWYLIKQHFGVEE